MYISLRPEDVGRRFCPGQRVHWLQSICVPKKDPLELHRARARLVGGALRCSENERIGEDERAREGG